MSASVHNIDMLHVGEHTLSTVVAVLSEGGGENCRDRGSFSREIEKGFVIQ